MGYYEKYSKGLKNILINLFGWYIQILHVILHQFDLFGATIGYKLAVFCTLFSQKLPFSPYLTLKST